MTKMIKILAVVATFFILTSCGYHGTLSRYQNVHSTTARVDLNKANFKVVTYAKGEAKCRYVLGFGGMKRNALIENARAEMFKNANLVGGSKVILNENVDVKKGFGFFTTTILVTVSGYVYEFKD